VTPLPKAYAAMPSTVAVPRHKTQDMVLKNVSIEFSDNGGFSVSKRYSPKGQEYGDSRVETASFSDVEGLVTYIRDCVKGRAGKKK
jgi:hypothetical protein